MRRKVFYCLLSILALTSQAAAWEIDHNLKDSRLRITTGDAEDPQGSHSYIVRVPDHITAVTWDEDSIYLLDPANRQLLVLTLYDLISADEGVRMSPYATYTLEKALKPGEIPRDIAAYQVGLMTTMVMTIEDDQAHETKLYRFSFAKREKPRFDQEEAKEDKREAVDPEPADDEAAVDYSKIGLIALSAEAVDILGSGPVTIVKNPDNLGVALLSLDTQKQILHQYDLNNPFDILYDHTYDVSFYPDILASKRVNLYSNSPETASFSIANADEHVALTLMQLEASEQIKRTNLLLNWNNAVQGNLWTDQLFFLSAFSGFIDRLDELYGNPNVDVEKLLDDPVFKKLTSDIPPEQVLAWAEESNLFTDEQLEEMRADYTLMRSRGRRWFFLASAIVGSIGFRRWIRQGEVPIPVRDIGEKAYRSGVKALSRIGIDKQRAQQALLPLRRAQEKFRNYLVRNIEAQRHQIYLIRATEKKLKRFPNLIKQHLEAAIHTEITFLLRDRLKKFRNGMLELSTHRVEEYQNLLDELEAGKSISLEDLDGALGRRLDEQGILLWDESQKLLNLEKRLTQKIAGLGDQSKVPAARAAHLVETIDLIDEFYQTNWLKMSAASPTQLNFVRQTLLSAARKLKQRFRPSIHDRSIDFFETSEKIQTFETKLALEDQLRRIQSMIFNTLEEARGRQTPGEGLAIFRDPDATSRAIDFKKIRDPEVILEQADLAIAALDDVERARWQRFTSAKDYKKLPKEVKSKVKELTSHLHDRRWSPESLDELYATITQSGKIKRFSTLEKQLNAAIRFSKSKTDRIHALSLELSKVLDDLSKQYDIIANWQTTGHTFWLWEHWANLVNLHAQFYIPKKTPFLGRVVHSKFFKRFFRSDFVYDGDPLLLELWRKRGKHKSLIQHKGTYEHVAVTGEDARLALVTGTFDVFGDSFAQWWARRNLADDKESIWGTGDSYLEIIPWEGKSYGPHFDAMTNATFNLWTWMFGMPLTYARLNKTHGSKRRLSYLRRLYDHQIKTIMPVQLGLVNARAWVFWYIAQQLILADYKQDYAGEFNSKDPQVRQDREREYQAFQDKLKGRTTSLHSIGERIMFNKTVGVPYIEPQHFMQSEFNKLARMMYKGRAPENAVSWFVMPITTGYFYHKWFGEYFGFNNPDMIRIMRVLKIDGILEKIDENGKPLLEKWSDHEAQILFYITALMEMERLQKIKPMPVDAGDEQVADWFEQVFKNLTEEDAGPQSFFNEDGEFIYKKEAKALASMFAHFTSGLAKFPRVAPGRNGGNLPVVKISKQKFPNDRLEAIERLLNQTSNVHAMFLKTLEAMRSNRGTIESLFDHTWYITLMDTAVMLDWTVSGQGLLGTGAATKKLTDLANRWHKAIPKLAQFGVIASLPYFLWADGQSDGHTKNAQELSLLLSEMQRILLSATEILMQEYMIAIVEERGTSRSIDDLVAFRDELEQSKEFVRSLLFDSKYESESLLDHRRYRISAIFTEYGPYGAGAGGAWLLTRNLFFRSSKGIITKMVDSFSTMLIKGSLTVWLLCSTVQNYNVRRIAISTQDFLSLHQAYYSLTLQIAILNTIVNNAKTGQPLDQNIRTTVAAKVQSEPFMREMNRYSQRLMKLVEPSPQEN